MNTLIKLRDNVETNLETLAKKTDLTPTELDTANKAVCLIEKIDKMTYDDEYHGATSEGHHMMRYYPSMDKSYGAHDMSMARGRDAHTGRYVSRDGYDGHGGRAYMTDFDTSGRRVRTPGMSYDGGYSWHSIDDRIIDQLERMMDSAQSEYEVHKLNQIIRVVESMKGE